MGESDEQKRGWRWWQWPVAVVVLAGVYVLSPGAVLLLQNATVGMESEWVNEYVWTKFYAPLQYLADESSMVQDFYEWFFALLGLDI